MVLVTKVLYALPGMRAIAPRVAVDELLRLANARAMPTSTGEEEEGARGHQACVLTHVGHVCPDTPKQACTKKQAVSRDNVGGMA